MVKHFSGGRQCGPRISYEPHVEDLLAAERISVLSHEVRSARVCRACRCGSYSARHYVQVPAEQEQDMRELGFELASPPEER